MRSAPLCTPVSGGRKSAFTTASMNARTDIEDSLETLSNKGVIPSSVFCYPGGRFNEATQQVLTTLLNEIPVPVEEVWSQRT